MRAIGEPIQGQDSDSISMGHLLSQLLEVTSQFKMKTQPQLLLLQKTMVVTEGVAREFNPKLNIWNLSKPILDDLTTIKDFHPSKFLFNEAPLNANAREIYTSIIRDIEKTRNDFNKIKKAFGEDGLKIDKNSLRLIKEKRKIEFTSFGSYFLIIFIVILAILLINK